MKYGMIVCCDCGKSVQRTGKYHKRCKECSKRHNIEIIISWRKSPKGKASTKASYIAYTASPKGKACQKVKRKNWKTSPKGKAYIKAKQKEWMKSPKGREYKKSRRHSMRATRNIFSIIALNTHLQKAI